MTKYVFAYHGGGSPENMTEEQGKAVMDAWMSWFGTLGAAVVDGGNPFGPSTTVGAGSSAGLTGYSIVSADNLDAASTMAKGCPILEAGGSVDVYETMEIM